MTILIDGYNLLHVTGIVGRGIGPGTLERSRNALLNWLAASLDDAERPLTTVVFDASSPPPGLPRERAHQGMCVRYATGYPSADALLEELIRLDSAPRRMVVVSSDHRVQRAARRRRATAVDSDLWYAEVRQRRQRVAQSAEPTSAKPSGRLTPDEVAFWLEEFGDAVDPSAVISAAESVSPSADERDSSNQGPRIDLAELANPFPPGYAEDLLDDE